MFPLFDFSCCVSTTRGTQLARLWSWDTLEANSSRGLESNLDLGGPLYQSNSHRSQLQLHHPMQFNHLIPFRGQSQQTSSQDPLSSWLTRSFNQHEIIFFHIMWCPRTIAKLLYLPRLSMVYGKYIYSINGVYKPTNITEGVPYCIYHCIYIYH